MKKFIIVLLLLMSSGVFAQSNPTLKELVLFPKKYAGQKYTFNPLIIKLILGKIRGADNAKYVWLKESGANDWRFGAFDHAYAVLPIEIIEKMYVAGYGKTDDEVYACIIDYFFDIVDGYPCLVITSIMFLDKECPKFTL